MRAMLAALQTEEIALLVFASGALLGWAFATAARRRDHTTFVLQRAPGLPIHALAAHDDAWLRGRIVAAQPLTCPWFDIPCVAYAYVREHEVDVEETDNKGNKTTRTEWRTEHSEAKSMPFDLDDGDAIRVALPEGENEAMTGTGHDYEFTRRRHSASVLRVGETVSVLGVKRDDGTFGPLAEVPLLVTRALRAERVRRSESSESVFLFFATLLPFAGLTVAAGLCLHAQDVVGWLIAAAIGLFVLVPQWWLLTNNRLVRLHQQVRAAQQQIAIELAQRSDLVPNLVAVVQRAAAHEKDLLTSLSSIRSGADLDTRVRGETTAAATAREVLLLHEKYPELRSDALYRDLHDRLWAIEEKIAHARGMYDDIVTEWNNRLEKFPSSLVAGSRHYQPAAVFGAEFEEKQPPRLAAP